MITVRKGELRDLEEIVEFQVLMGRETEDRELDRELVRKGVKGVVEKPERGAYVVAESEGRLVGSLLMTPEWSDWRAQTVIWFHSLYVLEAERGQGVFGKMYEYMRRMVEADEELAGLRLYTEVSNTGAQRSYERLGMRRGPFYLYPYLCEWGDE